MPSSAPSEANIRIVDASALVALILGEEGAEALAARLEGARLVAPSLLAFELTNVCLTCVRRQPRRREKLLAAFHAVRRLAIETGEIDQDGVFELAEATGLTAYDASYLWLARALGGDLITLDGKLIKAAADLGG